MCGVVGIYNHPEAANLAYLCLYALQHRGQESCGIVTSDGERLRQHKAMGLVADNFNQETLARLGGTHAIGQVRYSTAGSSTLENAQPFVVNFRHGSMAISHNGNLTNAVKRRNELERDGAIFQSTMDSEVIMHDIARVPSDDLVEQVIGGLKKVGGAYSLVFLKDDALVAARDPHGWRPLIIGKIDEAYVVVSETSALDLIGAKRWREVEPGEVVVFDKEGVHSYKPFEAPRKKAYCIFEYIYFARPDSHIFERDVYPIRRGFGAQLAKEHPVEADVVIPVPDSGVPAAIGYSHEAGIPFQMGLIRNHYVGRTFIEPASEIRHFGVKIKLNPVREVLEGKRVVVIDDSIVRGTTSMKIVKMIRDAGAKEVHVRISSPPTAWPCFYGIDTPTRDELIASHEDVERIREYIKADTLGYLSQDGLYWFEKKGPREWFCDGCFTGDYPVELEDNPEIYKMACESFRRKGECKCAS
jgi:amidophosphoribosyltransferase